MATQSATTVNVTIKSKLSGSSFHTRVSLDYKVENVISRAAAKFGTALINQGLDQISLAMKHVETSTRLMEGRTLGSYPIKDGDTLELYEESRAGSKAKASIAGYLTLHIYDTEGVEIYEKDTDATIFNLVRYYLSSTLYLSGVLGQQENHALVVIPRFVDDMEYQQPTLKRLAPEGRIQELQSGVHLVIEPDKHKSGEPVNYFRFMLIFSDDHVYLWDSETENLGYLNRMVRDALVRGGYVQPKQVSRCTFTVIMGGQPRRGEIIHIQSQNGQVFEMLEVDPVELSDRNLGNYTGLQQYGNILGSVPLILIQEDVLSRIFMQVRNNIDDPKEVAGIMLGNPFHLSGASQILIEISQIIEAKNAPATITSVAFTADVQDELDRIKSQDYPDAYKIGWYHSHPLTPTKSIEGEARSGIFFSAMDIRVHQQFRERWQVAMVVDGSGRKAVFYGWKDENCETIVEYPGFYSYRSCDSRS